ncbi:hypothetical protein AS156_05735 [Bradyrhizobium macuxiense]|uniref:Uncharacterized protein n=1 Tax=Bradyrhizobium macuxiense TaxID=1755647 RepID=A0A109JUW4_9BRAD|nr:hypothetical protein AS156_05735 [Bradyrhizobium macuxiense]
MTELSLLQNVSRFINGQTHMRSNGAVPLLRYRDTDSVRRSTVVPGLVERFRRGQQSMPL